MSCTSNGTMSQVIGLPVTSHVRPTSRRQASLTAAKASGRSSSSASRVAWSNADCGLASCERGGNFGMFLDGTIVRVWGGGPYGSAPDGLAYDLVGGTWSSVVSGSASLVTNSSGIAEFRSSRVKAATGSRFTFTVTGVTLGGYTYDATRNVETSDSITR